MTASESSAPCPGVSLPRKLGSTHNRNARLQSTRKATYCIFLVKFLETIPPSCCFSSCLPGRQERHRVLESASLGYHSGYGFDFQSCSAPVFINLGMVQSSGFEPQDFGI